MTLALYSCAPLTAVEKLFLIRSVASAVAALIFSKASLACAVPFSAVARNACVASSLGELADFAVVVLVVEFNMTHISLGRFLLSTSGRAALSAGRMSVESWFTLAKNLTDRTLAE